MTAVAESFAQNARELSGPRRLLKKKSAQYDQIPTTSGVSFFGRFGFEKVKYGSFIYAIILFEMGC